MKIYQSPLKLIVIIFFSVFIIEAFIMSSLYILPSTSIWIRIFIDATLLIILLSPILYFFGFRPLIIHILERKQAEDALKQLNHKSKLILEAAGEGIFGLDLDGRVVFANPAAARILG